MQNVTSAQEHPGSREVLLLLGLAAVPVGANLALASGSDAVATAVVVARGGAGVFFLVAALLLYLDWRIRSTQGRAWLVAAMVLLACQLLGSAALALDPLGAVSHRLGWPLVVDVAVTGVVVALAAVGLEERPPRAPDPLLTGLALGTVSTVAKPLLDTLDVSPPIVPTVIAGVIAGAYGVLAIAVAVRHALPRWLAWQLGVTLLVVSVGHTAGSPRFPSALLDLAAGTLLVFAGALWAGTSYAALRAALVEEHDRSVRLESSLMEMEGAGRGNREALHELKSTIAGLAKASELLGDAALPTDVQARLQQSLIRELARLERRLWQPDATDPAVVDLDLTLDTVLELHRARGRVFAWTPSGTSVVGRPDSIAEAVNILLDNAAAHGDATTGRVDVGPDETDTDMVRIAVSDGGPGVPQDMRDRIFEWGERRPSSTGQGIGLNVAQRLVNDLGGSLTLSEAGSGSSFVIRLPAARRSEEMLGARAELPAL